MAKLFVLPTAQRPFEINWPVEFTVPEDGGGAAPQTIMARFRVLPHSEVSRLLGFDLLQRAEETPNPLSQKAFTGPVDLLQAVLVGAEGLADPAGNPLPFSDEVRDQMIDTPFLRNALIKAYRRCSEGAAEKN
ncbi:MAG: hypothetical protein ACPG06_07860 [Alphaproteobacteria bacterium]